MALKSRGGKLRKFILAALIPSIALGASPKLNYLSIQKIGEHLMARSRNSALAMSGQHLGRIDMYVMRKNGIQLWGDKLQEGKPDNDSKKRMEEAMAKFVSDSVVPVIDATLQVGRAKVSVKKVGASNKVEKERRIIYELEFKHRGKR